MMGSKQFEGEIKDSEVEEYKEVSFKLFQHGDYKVRSSSSNGGFRCPLCNQENYDYTRLLRHAIQTAEAASTSGKQRARHSAMARYLAVDLAEEEDHKQASDSDDVPIVLKRFRSGTSSKNVLKSKAAAQTPASVDAQKVAMAEKREKEALNKAGELARKMKEMNALITMNNKELQKVREELMKEKALNNTLNGGDNSSIGVKKVGELDVNVFKRACAKRFPVGEAEIRGVELCSKWQERLNSHWSWHSEFRRFRDDEGNYKVVVNEEHETLRGLKEEWGDEVYNAVATALVDLHGYERYERVKEYEIWNFKENRRAKLEEVIGWLRSGKKELLESRYVVVSIK